MVHGRRVATTVLAAVMTIYLCVVFGHHDRLPAFTQDHLLLDKPLDTRPTIAFFGDSHLIDLTGVRPGDMPISEPNVQTDALGRILRAHHPGFEHWAIEVAAAPILRPIEELMVVGRFVQRGMPIRIAIIGLRWSQLDMYPPIARTELVTNQPPFGDPEYVLNFLKDSPNPASSTVANAIRKGGAATRVQPTGLDLLDGKLGAQLGSNVRLNLARVVNTVERYAGFAGIVEEDLTLVPLTDGAFFEMTRLLRSRGVEIICYLPPENPRPQFPSRLTHRPSLVALLRSRAATYGCSVLIDAIDLLANESHWGWFGREHDLMHFDREGHTKLASLIYEEAERRGLWSLPETLVSTNGSPP